MNLQNSDSPLFVVTAFGPFHTVKQNPTQVLLESFTKEELTALNVILTKVLSVSVDGVDEFFASIEDLPEKWKGKCIVFLHLGVYQSSMTINIEQYAKNKKHFFVPDANNYKPWNECIEESCSIDSRKKCKLPVKDLCSMFEEEKVKRSKDAGEYLCNYLYYKSLQFTEKRESCYSIFCHMPRFETISQQKQKEFLLDLIPKLSSCLCK